MTDDTPKETNRSDNAEQPAASSPVAAEAVLATDQPLLFSLGDPTEPADPPVASSQPKQSGQRAATVWSKARAPAAGGGSADDRASPKVDPEVVTVVYVDPFAVEPEPFNGRGLAAFDLAANRDLIDDMRRHGNTVPVRLRPKSDGTGWTCASGSRRVNAGRVIAAERPAFQIAAIVDAGMSDADAYALCLADNHGRNEVTALQQGREIKWAIANLFGGSRQEYIDAHGTDKSVVSRALELVNLPEAVLAAAEDREALSTLFAEKLAPKLKIAAERKVVFTRLKALGADKLPGPRLQRYLLTGERDAFKPDRRIVRFGSGRNRVRASVTVAKDRSALFKLPATGMLTEEDRQGLRTFLSGQIDELLE